MVCICAFVDKSSRQDLIDNCKANMSLLLILPFKICFFGATRNKISYKSQVSLYKGPMESCMRFNRKLTCL